MGLKSEMEWTIKRYNTNMDPEMEWNHCPPQKLSSDFYSYGLNTLDGSTCKNVLLVLQLYIYSICVKNIIKWSSQQKMELPNNSEYEHRSISSLKKSPSLHKRVSSKLSFKAIKIALEK